jgi:pimeloyl-ACP methyl ester carboxylesterase
MPLSHRMALTPRARTSGDAAGGASRAAGRRPLLPALAAIVAAATLAIAGCTSSGAAAQGGGSPSAQAAPPAGAATPHWHPCSLAGAAVQCATLRVPLDYQHPSGRKITLALSMVPATAPASQREGDLLVNPGGPGGPGRNLSVDVAYGLDHSVSSRYNVIGFDPRGVGASVPALHCDTSFFAGVRPDYIPANAQAEAVLKARAKSYAADCQRRFGWLLPYLTTENVARDMDTIRAALGQRQISYFGYSYGTYIGQVYATMFGKRVHRMVLDSIVDPSGVWYADNIGQDYAFEGRMLAFFSWVASHNAVYHLGATRQQVDQAWYRARAKLAAHPVIGPGGPMIGADEYDDTFLQGGYNNGLWPGLATALASYLHSGDTRQMVIDYHSAGEQNENEFAVYNAVECADVSWPRSWAKWDSDTRRVYRTAPFQAWDNAWFNAACAYWPVHGPARPLQIRGKGLPGILMIQGTLDAATPYAGAQVAHKALPSSRMLVVTGGGNHGQSLAQPPNACVNGFLNRYLATGALPERPGQVNGTCPALPPPPPSG